MYYAWYQTFALFIIASLYRASPFFNFDMLLYSSPTKTVRTIEIKENNGQ